MSLSQVFESMLPKVGGGNEWRREAHFNTFFFFLRLKDSLSMEAKQQHLKASLKRQDVWVDSKPKSATYYMSDIGYLT